MNSFYSQEELIQLGLQSIGNNVLISRKVSIYGSSNIQIGNDVRIDDFCVISAGNGGIYIGNHVHIGVFCNVQGNGRIFFSDFSGLSSRVSIYSSSDDYTGEFLTNPTIPVDYRGVTDGDVYLGKHVIIGSGAVILPNVTIEDGVAIGALSLVNKNCQAFYIYSGIPVRKLVSRSEKMLDLEALCLSLI